MGACRSGNQEVDPAGRDNQFYGYPPSVLRSCWEALPAAFLSTLVAAMTIPAYVFARDEGDLGGIVAVPLLAALPYLAWRSARRSVRAMSVGERGLTVHYWLRAPRVIPWSEVAKAEKPIPAGISSLWFADVRVHVTPQHGGPFAIPYSLPGMRLLCDEIISRVPREPESTQVGGIGRMFRHSRRAEFLTGAMLALSPVLFVSIIVCLARTGHASGWETYLGDASVLAALALWVWGVLWHGVVKRVEVTPQSLRFHLWMKQVVDVPWSDVIKPKSYPSPSALTRVFAGWPIFVSRHFGRAFRLTGRFEDMGLLYHEISARAKG